MVVVILMRITGTEGKGRNRQVAGEAEVEALLERERGQSGVRRHKVGLKMGNLGIKQKHSLKSGELVTLKIFATLFFLGELR